MINELADEGPEAGDGPLAGLAKHTLRRETAFSIGVEVVAIGREELQENTSGLNLNAEGIALTVDAKATIAMLGPIRPRQFQQVGRAAVYYHAIAAVMADLEKLLDGYFAVKATIAKSMSDGISGSQQR